MLNNFYIIIKSVSTWSYLSVCINKDHIYINTANNFLLYYVLYMYWLEC